MSKLARRSWICLHILFSSCIYVWGFFVRLFFQTENPWGHYDAHVKAVMFSYILSTTLKFPGSTRLVKTCAPFVGPNTALVWGTNWSVIRCKVSDRCRMSFGAKCPKNATFSVTVVKCPHCKMVVAKWSIFINFSRILQSVRKTLFFSLQNVWVAKWSLQTSPQNSSLLT